MLRIAVPNKGSLADPAAEMLRESGYRSRRDARELVLADPENDAEFFFLRPRDVAVYVGAGTLDVGITGRDLLLDSGASAEEVMSLGFGGSTFRFAGPPDGPTSVTEVGGHRVATSYPGLVARHLETHGVTADVVRLDGAVESAVQLGVADVIADVVETGSTLRAAGLVFPTTGEGQGDGGDQKSEAGSELGGGGNRRTGHAKRHWTNLQPKLSVNVHSQPLCRAGRQTPRA